MKKEKNTSEGMKIFEVSIIYRRPLLSAMKSVASSQDVDTFLRNNIDLGIIDLKECFWVILMSNSNNILGFSEIGKGDAKGVVVNITEIFQLIIKTNTTAIIVCHNHPSGKLKPSKRDEDMTDRIKQGCELFSIALLDHIIITSESYFSFADEGIL